MPNFILSEHQIRPLNKLILTLLPASANFIFRIMSKLKFAIALLFPLLPFFSFGQIENMPFPKSWEGKWSGTLGIFRDTGKVQELPMELHILPIDSASNPSWTWTIIYGEDKAKGKRPYELITLDAAK